jgi:16S rRNA processing protein RimM
LAPDADLVGLEVINTAGERLGKVTGLIETGANAVMRVVDDVGLERLLPFVSAVIQAVDGEAGRIRVEWGSDW